MRTLRLAPAAALVALTAACGHRAPPVAAAPPPDLDQRADQQAHSAAPTGERVGEVLHGVSHEEDQFTDWRVQLDAGQCYWFGYAGDGGITKFSMYIFSPTDSRLDSARGKPPQGVFTHCAQQSGIYRVQGKVAGGAGHYAVVVYKTKGQDPPPPPKAEPKLDLEAMIEKQAAATAPGAKRVGEFFAGTADTSDWATAMEPGKCYWIIGAGEPKKVKKLWLYLWDGHNKRITESKSDSETAVIGHCATEAGMFKFQAKVESGSGPYKVGVYAK